MHIQTRHFSIDHGKAAPVSRRFVHSGGFTMVEVALSIAIVAFAMVAIIGIMPTGFEAQRLNREETIINQDGTYLMEAIRGGALELDTLTNFVDSIVISNQLGNVRSVGISEDYNRFRRAVPLVNGQFIIGMLSTPHLEVINVDQSGALVYSTNEVAAMVRAMSGSAGERFSEPDFQENSFSYLLSSKIVPYQASPTGPFAASSTTLTSTNRVSLSANIASNLFDVQLKFRWPVTKVQTAGTGGMPNIQYRVGKNEMVFRSLVSGSLMPTNGFPFLSVRDPRKDVPLYYFNDNEYTSPAL